MYSKNDTYSITEDVSYKKEEEFFKVAVFEIDSKTWLISLFVVIIFIFFYNYAFEVFHKNKDCISILFVKNI